MFHDSLKLLNRSWQTALFKIQQKSSLFEMMDITCFSVICTSIKLDNFMSGFGGRDQIDLLLQYHPYINH